MTKNTILALVSVGLLLLSVEAITYKKQAEVQNKVASKKKIHALSENIAPQNLTLNGGPPTAKAQVAWFDTNLDYTGKANLSQANMSQFLGNHSDNTFKFKYMFDD